MKVNSNIRRDVALATAGILACFGALRYHKVKRLDPISAASSSASMTAFIAAGALHSSQSVTAPTIDKALLALKDDDNVTKSYSQIQDQEARDLYRALWFQLHPQLPLFFTRFKYEKFSTSYVHSPELMQACPEAELWFGSSTPIKGIDASHACESLNMDPSQVSKMLLTHAINQNDLKQVDVDKMIASIEGDSLILFGTNMATQRALLKEIAIIRWVKAQDWNQESFEKQVTVEELQGFTKYGRQAIFWKLVGGFKGLIEELSDQGLFLIDDEYFKALQIDPAQASLAAAQQLGKLEELKKTEIQMQCMHTGANWRFA